MQDLGIRKKKVGWISIAFFDKIKVTQCASVSEQVTFEKNGDSSVMLLEDCICERWFVSWF